MIDVPLHHYFRGYGFPEPDTEVKFHPTRQWRFDFLFPGKVAVEVNGGVWLKGGAHALPTNILRDYAKVNAAQLMGYLVLQFTPEQIRSGEFVETLQEALKIRGKMKANAS